MTRFVWLLAACAPAVQPLLPGEAERLLADISAAEAQRTAMAADGVVTLRKSGVPVKGQIALLTDASGRIRIDIASEAGSTLFAFASDGKTSALLDLQNRRFTTGSQLLRGISPLALSRLFLARQPCADPRVVSANTLVTQRCLGGTLTTTYDQRRNLRRVQLEGPDHFDATLLAHTALGLPRRLEVKTSEGDVVVQLSEVDPKPMLDPAAFILEAPPGLH